MIKILGQINDNKLPEVETERLYLRQRLVSDAKDIFDYASLPEVTWPAGFPPVKSVAEEENYLDNIMPKRWSEQNIPAGYGICHKDSNRVIGSVDFNHRHADDVFEMGYLLHQDYWGQGIMPEAARGCWRLDLIWSASIKSKLNVIVTTKLASVLLKSLVSL